MSFFDAFHKSTIHTHRADIPRTQLARAFPINRAWRGEDGAIVSAAGQDAVITSNKSSTAFRM